MADGTSAAKRAYRHATGLAPLYPDSGVPPGTAILVQAHSRHIGAMMRTFRPAHCRVALGANIRSVKSLFLVLGIALPGLAVTSGAALNYSTWLPTSSVSYNTIDGSGAQYFSGSAEFPCQTPAGGPQVATGVYSVIGKLQPRGDNLAWSVCLAGTARGLYVDTTGAIYAASQTGTAATMTKLAPEAAKVLYSVSIPFVDARTMTVGQDGSLYVAGIANPGFAATQGAYQAVCRYASDCGFLAKLAPAGVIEYATYSGTNHINSIAVNSHSEAWITGSSRAFGFSYSQGNVTFGIGVLAKFNSNGIQLYNDSWFAGGICYQTVYEGEGFRVAVDSNDAVYAVGRGLILDSAPPLPIPGSPSNECEWAPSVVKLDGAGNLVYKGYIAGNYSIPSIAVDPAGSLYFVLGQASYMDSPRCGAATTPVIILSRDGSSVMSSAAVPGSAVAITQDGNGGVYVVGSASAPFVATPGAYAEQPLSDLPPYGSYAAKLDFTKPAAPSIGCLVNAASGWPGRNSFAFTGAVSPGEVVTLFGEGFQPGPDLRVTFDGRPAPVLYADTGQINTVVPFEIGGSSGVTRVAVQSKVAIGPYSLPVSPAVPGIFGAVNENGTVNSKSNPAAPGSIVAVFLTGAGAFDTEINDGSVGPTIPPYPVPVIGVSAQFGTGQSPLPGEVLFVGQAPEIIAGVVQLNLKIPQTLNPGAVLLTVYFGNYPSPVFTVYVGGE